MIHKIFAQKKDSSLPSELLGNWIAENSRRVSKNANFENNITKIIVFFSKLAYNTIKNSLTLIFYLLFGIYKGFDYWASNQWFFYALFSQTGLLAILLAVYVYHNHLRNNLYQICRNQNLQTENSCYFILLLL